MGSVEGIYQRNRNAKAFRGNNKSTRCPITTEAFHSALKLLKVGKAPGPNRYTLSYYKLFTERLAPRFTAAYNSLCDGEDIPTNALST